MSRSRLGKQANPEQTSGCTEELPNMVWLFGVCSVCNMICKLAIDKKSANTLATLYAQPDVGMYYREEQCCDVGVNTDP